MSVAASKMSSVPGEAQRKIKLGIISNEFFDLSLERMGGFGWATRQVATCLRDPSSRVEVVFLSGEHRPASRTVVHIHDTRLVGQQSRLLTTMRAARAERCDLFLTIDFRPNFAPFLWGAPRVPLIVWVRDPRTPEDDARVASVRIPGRESELPRGVAAIDCTSLGRILRVTSRLGRKTRFVSPAPSLLGPKVAEAYGIRGFKTGFLPNPIPLSAGRIEKASRPTILFLGRLDPYKRPWMFAELARAFPHVEFIMAGQAHFQGRGAWHPESLPPNVRLLGHVGEKEKAELLRSAWILVNTSISEGLAVSLLEALSFEVPIVSCQDPEGITSRFGVFVGRWDGTGMDGVPTFVEGLSRLLTRHHLRASLGAQGRKWVEQTHSRARFLERFYQICSELEVGH